MANNDEQEVELVKNFIREYGPWIAAGLVIGLASMFGWRSYQNAQLTAAQEKTSAYQQALEQLQEVEGLENTDFANEVLVALEGSSQAALTRMQLASKAVNDGNLNEAATLLTEALKETSRDELKGIIAIRLARVELARSEFQAAESALALVPKQGFGVLKAEVAGDVFFAQGKLSDAKASYEQAISLSNAGAHPFLQMKLDNLAAY